MSVIHSLLYSTALVRNDPRRDARTLWPRGTTVAEHDVIVAGKSLTALVRERRTPCVLIAPDAVARTDAYMTLIITQVTARDSRRGWHRGIEITVDCRLEDVVSRIMHAELLNSPHECDLAPMTIRAADGVPLRARLPWTTSPGDLVLLACGGTIALNQVSSSAQAAPSSTVSDDETRGSCRKYVNSPLGD